MSDGLKTKIASLSLKTSFNIIQLTFMSEPIKAQARPTFTPNNYKNLTYDF